MVGKHVKKEAVIAQKFHGFIENKSYQRNKIFYLKSIIEWQMRKKAISTVFHFSETVERVERVAV